MNACSTLATSFEWTRRVICIFVGRTSDIIKTRGEKVSPKEVENVICSLEGVAEAVVVGLRDPVLGQAVKAVVTVRAKFRLTSDEVLRHCARHLQGFMVPKIVEFRGSLPRTTSGKVDRKELGAVAG